MNLDEFKQKANEIKKEIQPKVKNAGKRVTDFVDEHFSKERDDTKEAEGKDVIEAEYVDVTENEETNQDNNDSTPVDSEAATKKSKGKRNKGKKSKKAEETVEEVKDENVSDEGSLKEGHLEEESLEEGSFEEEHLEEVHDGFSDILNAQVTEESEVKDEEASGMDESDADGETVEEESDNVEPESEIERIEGVVVGTMKDKYNQFKLNVLPKVKDVASNVGSKAKETAVTVGNKVKEKAIDIAPKAKEAVGNVGSKVMGTAMGIGPKAKNTAQDIGSKVKQTAQDFGPKAKDTVVDTAKQVGPKVYEGAKKAGETISFQGYRLRKTIGKKFKNSIKKKLGLGDDESGDGDGIKYYEVKRKKTNRLVAHFRTVTTHKHLVFKHCVKAGIPLQGLTHDLSKFSPTEFMYGVKFYRGDKSPNEGEREDHGFSYAWMHHKGRNKHHFEYWNDYNIEANKALPVKMPLKYVVEMFCDRVAASKVYLKDRYTNKSPYEYFDKGRSRRTIHQETSDFLEKLLKMLAEKGEPYTFMYIKWYMKHHKDY